MSEILSKMRFSVDLQDPLITQAVNTVLQQGDKGANMVEAEIFDMEERVDLSGYTAEGVMLKRSGKRILMNGTVKGNVAEVPLKDECYNTEGPYVFSVRLKNEEGVKRTVLRFSGMIEEGGDEWND